ncbi:unnamed protein product [Microthlaspi erraticum]|uniref:Uncharacterized protein n=1 Tax=Microthlaspi erraticum TaxID=1685480 RepID=A0A6D2JVN0_9BRAS|nr:unnamed protein product [Microthlaspi erraticum]
MGSSSSSSCGSASSMAHLGSLLITLINQLVHLFSFLFTLSLITSSSLESHPPLEQGSLQSQTLPCSLSLLWVIPLLGSPFFPQPLFQTAPQRHPCIRSSICWFLSSLSHISFILHPFSHSLAFSPSF